LIQGGFIRGVRGEKIFCGFWIKKGKLFFGSKGPRRHYRSKKKGGKRKERSLPAADRMKGKNYLATFTGGRHSGPKEEGGGKEKRRFLSTRWGGTSSSPTTESGTLISGTAERKEKNGRACKKLTTVTLLGDYAGPVSLRKRRG